MREIIGLLAQTLESPAADKGYSPLGPFAERHGSWEKRFYKGNDLNRFVNFSVTASMPSPEKASGVFDIEIWIGADRGKRYVNSLAWSYGLDEEQLRTQSDREQLLPVLRSGFIQACTAADNLTAADLTRSYATDDAVPRVA